MSANARDVAIVVPAFNEGRVIGDMLASLLGLAAGHAIVVVDDGSTDDTAAVAARYPVHLLTHACNLGAGAATHTGMQYAIDTLGARFIVTVDSDGQHRADDIEQLLAPLRAGTHDVVLGTRFSPEVIDATRREMPLAKRLLLRCAIAFTRLTTGLQLTDTNIGLRAFTRAALRSMTLEQNRMAHCSEVEQEIARKRLRWCEIPVIVHYTSYSVRKGQGVWNSIDIVWELLTLRMR